MDRQTDGREMIPQCQNLVSWYNKKYDKQIYQQTEYNTSGSI